MEEVELKKAIREDTKRPEISGDFTRQRHFSINMITIPSFLILFFVLSILSSSLHPITFSLLLLYDCCSFHYSFIQSYSSWLVLSGAMKGA